MAMLLRIANVHVCKRSCACTHASRQACIHLYALGSGFCACMAARVYACISLFLSNYQSLMYIYIHIHTYIYTYIYIYIYAHTHTHVRVYLPLKLSMSSWHHKDMLHLKITSVLIHIHMCIHTYMYIYIYIYTHTHMCVCLSFPEVIHVFLASQRHVAEKITSVLIHIHMRIHAYTDTHTRTCECVYLPLKLSGITKTCRSENFICVFIFASSYQCLVAPHSKFVEVETSSMHIHIHTCMYAYLYVRLPSSEVINVFLRLIQGLL
jgi:hypothetical protein